MHSVYASVYRQHSFPVNPEHGLAHALWSVSMQTNPPVTISNEPDCWASTPNVIFVGLPCRSTETLLIKSLEVPQRSNHYVSQGSLRQLRSLTAVKWWSQRLQTMRCRAVPALCFSFFPIMYACISWSARVLILSRPLPHIHPKQILIRGGGGGPPISVPGKLGYMLSYSSLRRSSGAAVLVASEQ